MQNTTRKHKTRDTPLGKNWRHWQEQTQEESHRGIKQDQLTETSGSIQTINTQGLITNKTPVDTEKGREIYTQGGTEKQYMTHEGRTKTGNHRNIH